MLRFLGRDSAFHTHNNCAFFVQDGGLVLMDCPISAFHSLRKLGVDKLAGGRAERITVIVTHTHTDHIGGIGMLVHYCYYVLKIPVVIVAPSDEVANDLRMLTDRLDGCAEDGYRIVTVEKAELGFPAVPILTTHAEQLEGRCFGWSLDISGRRVVYTGDTNTLEPFMPYLSENSYLYTEVSAYESPVHLNIQALRLCMDKLSSMDVKVFLMHLDDREALASEAVKLGIQLAPLYEEN